MRKILVVGLLPYDSGKTEFVLGLSDALMKRGVKINYFKPLAGHNGWFQHSTLIHSLELRLLVGHDAYIVADKIGQKDLLPLISPLDILTMPIDPSLETMSTRKYLEHMTTTSKISVLARFTRNMIADGKLHSSHLYIFCKDTYNKLTDRLKAVIDDLINALKTKENTVFMEANTGFLEDFLSKPEIYNVLDENYEFFKNYDFLIIESYNDASAPTYKSLLVDYVFLVAPGKAALYRGDRYAKAVEVFSYRGMPWNIKTSSIYDLLGKPLKTFDIPLRIYSMEYYALFDEITDFISRGMD